MARCQRRPVKHSPRTPAKTTPLDVGMRHPSIIEGRQFGYNPVTRWLLSRSDGPATGRADQRSADRTMVMAVTAQASAGCGGMADLLWSQAWLTDTGIFEGGCP